jgi:hypothetical protein
MSRLRAQGLIADRDEEGVAADARSRRAAVDALALATTRRPSEQGRDQGERLTAMARPRPQRACRPCIAAVQARAALARVSAAI